MLEKKGVVDKDTPSEQPHPDKQAAIDLEKRSDHLTKRAADGAKDEIKRQEQ